MRRGVGGARGAHARLARPPTAVATDRLSRVEELRGVLAATGETAPADLDAALAALFSLADDEIIENLAGRGALRARPRSSRSGSTPSWRPGAARASACTASARAPGQARSPSGCSRCPDRRLVGSVRVYGRRRDGEVARLAAITHDGTPELHRWASRARRRAAVRGDLARGRVGIRRADARDRAVASRRPRRRGAAVELGGAVPGRRCRRSDSP